MRYQIVPSAMPGWTVRVTVSETLPEQVARMVDFFYDEVERLQQGDDLAGQVRAYQWLRALQQLRETLGISYV
jgi:hypothetical protein